MDSNRHDLLFGHLCVILIILLIAPALSAQSTTSLSGYVYDREDGTPIEAAEVQLASTGFKTQTDSRGFFSLEHVLAGSYTIWVTAAGYEFSDSIEVTVHADVSSNLAVYLEKKIYPLEGITVTDTTLVLTGDKTIVIDRNTIKRLNHSSLADLLADVEGVQVQRSGTSTGEVHISIRGSQPKHVLVLLDGQKMNLPQTGVADLQTIPLEMIERIEIYSGGASAEFGPDALAGAINIISVPEPSARVSNTKSFGRWGSWDAGQIGFSFSNLLTYERLTTRGAYLSKKSTGNFNFAYSVQPTGKIHEGTRLNNSFESNNYFVAGNYEFSTETNLQFSGQLYGSKNGLPDRAIRQNPNASKKDDRKLLSLSLVRQPSQKLHLNLHLGYQRLNQRFNDTLSAPVNQFRSDYVNDQLSAKFSGVWRPVPTNRMSFGLQTRNEKLRHSDLLRPANSLGESTRKYYGFFISDVQHWDISALRFLNGASIDFALRYDRAETFNNSASLAASTESNNIGFWSPGIGAALSYQGGFDFILRANYGKSFRLPSINSLFWKGDVLSQGNPSLRPERSEHSEIGAELRHTYRVIILRGNITYFHSHITDLIIWSQGYGGVWRPENLLAALIVGHNESASLSLWDESLVLQYQNSITISRNRSGSHATFDKELTFTPHYVTNLSARINRSFVSASYSIRLVDQRYALPNNQKAYGAYRVDDLMIKGSMRLFEKWQAELEYRLYNIWNENYVLITHYPMPPKEWSIGISLSYGG